MWSSSSVRPSSATGPARSGRSSLPRARTTGSSPSTSRSPSRSPTRWSRAIAFALAAVVAGLTVARVQRTPPAGRRPGTRRLRRPAHRRGQREPRRVPRRHDPQPPYAAGVDQGCRCRPCRTPPRTSTKRPRALLLATAHEEAERLERLVTKVLELSRIHAGVLDARPRADRRRRAHARRGTPAPISRRARPCAPHRRG